MFHDEIDLTHLASVAEQVGGLIKEGVELLGGEMRAESSLVGTRKAELWLGTLRSPWGVN